MITSQNFKKIDLSEVYSNYSLPSIHSSSPIYCIFQGDHRGEQPTHQDNGVHGLDGNSLTVIGYKKGDPLYNIPAQFSYVYRWAYERTSLKGPFNLIRKFCGNKSDCIGFEWH